jgi:DNA polymerase (family 10)
VSEKKDEIVAMLSELAELTILDEADPQSFRVRAYENAMTEIKGYGGELENLSVKELCKIPSIGKSTAEKIRQFLDTGKVDKLEGLRKKFPPAVLELSRLPGLGPKTLLRLRNELGVENIDDLRAAISEKRLRELKGLGAKVEEKLLSAIEKKSVRGKDHRRSIAEAMPVAEGIAARLRALKPAKAVQVCGSLRRLRESVADIDIVVATAEPAKIMAAFAKFPEVAEVLGSGDTKTSIVTSDGLQIDVRAVPQNAFGAASLYFTGSKAHNIKIRQLALDHGWTLNEYGLNDVATGKTIAAKTEEEIYRALGMAWVPPSLREDCGEVEAALENKLPALDVKDIAGLFLPVIDEAACKQALERKLSYLVATDTPEKALAPLKKTFPKLALEVARAPERIEKESDIAAATRRKRLVGIDGSLEHLAPTSHLLQRARGLDLTFALSLQRVDDLDHGVAHCLRGWVGKDRLVNTRPVDEVRALL